MIITPPIPGLLFYFLRFLCFCGASKTTVSYCVRIVIHSDSIFHEDSLHETGPCRNLDGFILSGIVGQLCKNMTFIIRKEIITINDSHCIIQLQAEFESQSASRITFQDPAFFHFHVDTCRDLYDFTGLHSHIHRCVKIVSCTS